jgi:hypothetical protein
MAFLSGRTSLTTVQTADLADNSVTLAKFAHGTASQNIAYDGSGVPVDVALSTGASAAEKTNIMVNAFNIAAAGGFAYLNMVDGVVDEFEDETGVDTSSSTNAGYDVTNDLYDTAQSQISQSDGTRIGNMTAGAGLVAAFDGDNTKSGSEAARSENAVTTAYIGKDWGSGETKTVSGFKVWSSSNTGFDQDGNSTITLTLEGSTDNFSASVVNLGGITGFTDANETTQKDKLTGLTTSTAYRYHRLKVTMTTSTGEVCVAEVEFYKGGAGNMTLLSNATTALAAPDDANIVIWQQDTDAITLNTDLKAYSSRNGGTTYTQMTLAEVASLTTGRILTGTVDISGQSSATAMKYKIETLNTKDQKIHAVALQWS